MAEISTVVRELGAEVASRITPDEFPYFMGVGLGFMVGAMGGAMLRGVHVRSRLDVMGLLKWTSFFVGPLAVVTLAGINYQRPDIASYGIAGLFGIASGYLGMMAVSQ